jgi:hypothetical protein
MEADATACDIYLQLGVKRSKDAGLQARHASNSCPIATATSVFSFHNAQIISHAHEFTLRSGSRQGNIPHQ